MGRSLTVSNFATTIEILKSLLYLRAVSCANLFNKNLHQNFPKRIAAPSQITFSIQLDRLKYSAECELE
jgi:hypothetical protein